MEQVEDSLQHLILENLQFTVNEKIIKTGFLEVFNTKQFFIKFKLKEGEKVKDWELPYPYRIEKINDKKYLFDYCLSAFVPRTEEVYWIMRTLSKADASRLYDNYLFVEKISA